MCRERDEMFYRVYDESRECGAETRRCVNEERTLLCAEGCTLTDAACMWRTHQGVRLVAENPVVRCADGMFMGASWCANCVDGKSLHRRVCVRVSDGLYDTWRECLPAVHQRIVCR